MADDIADEIEDLLDEIEDDIISNKKHNSSIQNR